MTEQERIDKINQLRIRHAEAQKLADRAQDKYMIAAANAVRIRNALEDLLAEAWINWVDGDSPPPANARVEVRSRNYVNRVGLAGAFEWHTGEIIRYRFVEETAR
jgi:hypothetical protein